MLVLIMISRHIVVITSELLSVQVLENLYKIGLWHDNDLLCQQNADELSHISLINQSLTYFH
jgi:hypothetical protein